MVRTQMNTAYGAVFLGTAIFFATRLEGVSEDSPRKRIRGSGVERQVVTAPSQLPVSRWTDEPVNLPPLPEGVEDLKFSNFFKMPVGPLGLEVTDQLRGMEGKMVRLVGYFVFEDWSSCSCPAPEPVPKVRGGRMQPAWMQHVIPGRVMMSSLPMSVSLGHYGLSEDLPPQLVFVRIGSRFGEPVFHRPGLFAVTGKLSLGNREEPDGRISFVRLEVEEESAIQSVGRSAEAGRQKISETQPLQPNQP
jgi:hypothetical protein